MNMKFYDSCYNMAALSTCVLSNSKDRGEWVFGKTDQISITENLTAVVKYEELCSDEMSISDYEIHYFSIEFFRNGLLLDSFSFEKKINKTMFGSLANPELSIEAKMKVFNKLKPNLRSKIRNLITLTTLTPQEVEAVITKTEELTENVSSLIQEQGKKI